MRRKEIDTPKRTPTDGTERKRTPDEKRILDDVEEYEARRIGGPEARAWVESHVELILSQARMMGELDSADFDATSAAPPCC